MTLIAEAFVAVRPDTSNFAKEVRAGLKTSLATVKSPVIPVTVSVNKASIAALQRSLRATPLSLPVELTLAPGALTRLQAQIRAAGKAVSIPVEVTTRGARAVSGDAAVGAAGGAARSAQATADAAAAQAQKVADTAAAKARDSLRASALLRASADAAGATAATELQGAQRKLQTSISAVTRAETGFNAALKTTDIALQEEAAAAVVLSRELREVARAQAQVAATQARFAPGRTAVSGVEAAVARAQTPVGTTQVEKAQRAATSAAAAGRDLAKVQLQVARGELLVSDAEKVRIATLTQEIPLLEVKTAAELRDVKALQAQSTAQAQALRGAGATGATFLGLRGAVLSSSGPFLAATIAVTALAKSIGTASSLQASLNTFQATTQATDATMKEVSATATQLGADLTLPSTSALDAAQAMTELSKAGLTVQDSMDATRGVLELATAAELTASDAAKIAATQLNAFGLAGDQAGRVTDLLAGAAISAQGEISDFAAAFQQASAQAAQSGLSIEQTTALLTQLARAGIRGSDAGTSLRVELLRLVPSTKPAIEAFRTLGIQIDETATIGSQLPSIIDQFSRSLAKFNPQQQTALIRDIFGQDAGRAAIVTLTQGVGAFNQTEAAVSKTGNAAQITAGKTKGLKGATDALGSTTQNLATTIGNDLLPALEATAEALTSIVTAADQVLSSIKPVIDAVGGVTSGIFGGGGNAAELAIVLATGVAINKLLAARAAKQIAATAAVEGAEVTAAATTQRSWALAFRNIVAAARGRTAAQVASANEVAAAEARAGAGAAGGRGIRGFSGAGVGIGIAATILGSQIGGDVGGFLSGAGQGAALGGSFLGVPGAIAGAGLGAAFTAVQRDSRRLEEMKAKWDALTFQEQLAFIRSQPKAFAALANIAGLKLKNNPFQGRFFVQEGFDAAAKQAANQARDSALAERVPAPFDIASVLSNRPAGTIGAAPAPVGGGILSEGDRNQLAIARAQAQGNNTALAQVLREQLTAVNQRIFLLDLQRTRGKNNNQQLKAIKDDLVKAFTEKKELLSQINQVLADLASTTGNPALARNDLAQARAQGTKTLADNLAAAQQRVEIYQKILATTKAEGAALQQIKLDFINSQNAVTGVQNDIATAAQAAADQQAQAQELALRRAAEAANHQGAAEAALLAFLQSRVAESKGNALAFQQASSALVAEQQAKKDAIETSTQIRFDTRASAIDAAAAAADLTKTASDDIKVELRRKKLLQLQLRHAREIRDAAKAGTDAWFKAQQTVNGLKGAISGVDATLKDLRGQAGGDGFSLEDLFKKAADEFREFGGFSRGRSGILSPQDARGFLGKTIHENQISDAEKQSLSEQRKQTAELTKISANTSQTFIGRTEPEQASKKTPKPRQTTYIGNTSEITKGL
jgi:TP901 family phage tail tape measure protein